MKINFKKLSTVVVSALSILVLTPSAFCGKKTNTKKTAPQNARVLNATKNITEDGRYVARMVNGRTLVLQELGDLVPNRYSRLLIEGIVTAPHASGIVKTNAFYRQSGIVSLSLPLIRKIEAYAFNGCTSLEYLSLSNNLTYVDPKAFDGCNSSLIICLNDTKYTINEFLALFATR